MRPFPSPKYHVKWAALPTFSRKISHITV
uniref:Uncharacterized protein n=1 Tax=Rhizophora mucronata TaxID=61149 RepID=A0A2P2Q941_RHIMU